MLGDRNFKFIKKNLFFKNVNESHYKHLYKSKNFVNASDGDIIYSFDDPADYMFLIVLGEVKMKFSKDKPIEYKYVYDFFGETELLEKSLRFSCAIANKETLLYKISAEEFQLLMIGNEAITNNLVDNTGLLIDQYNNKPDLEFDSYLEPDNYTEENSSSENLEGLDLSDIEQPAEEFIEDVLSEEELDSIVDNLKTKHQIEDELGQSSAAQEENDLEYKRQENKDD